jgi:hypothetical protein
LRHGEILRAGRPAANHKSNLAIENPNPHRATPKVRAALENPGPKFQNPNKSQKAKFQVPRRQALGRSITDFDFF